MYCTSCGNEIKTGKFGWKSGKLEVQLLEKKKLCESCFENQYGEILDISTNARYHGGQKDKLAGGTFRDKDNGRLFLTERYLIFEQQKILGDGYSIEIPFEKVLISGWSTEEDSRLKSFIAGGAGFGGIMGGGGILHNVGKSHQIVLPYIDENEIEQMPRFSVGLGKTKNWAKQIYETIVKVRKKQGMKGEKELPSDKEGDSISILKKRLAKGEIDVEEYNKMKKILED